MVYAGSSVSFSGLFVHDFKILQFAQPGRNGVEEGTWRNHVTRKITELYHMTYTVL